LHQGFGSGALLASLQRRRNSR